jgi:2,3-bisphosphoglycerate-dependent phosphoglycerate mutase
VRLYFTRHGESEANRLQVISNRDLQHALTPAGVIQAEALAARFARMPISRIYTSPILRARQTGEILSAQLGVPLELADGLREPDCGALEGRCDAEAWAEHRVWMETWLSGRDLDRGPQGGESYAAVRKRFTSFVLDLVGKYKDSPTEFILLTHGAALLFSLPGLVEGLDVPYLHEHGVGHADVLQVVYRDGRLILEA